MSLKVVEISKRAERQTSLAYSNLGLIIDTREFVNGRELLRINPKHLEVILDSNKMPESLISATLINGELIE